MIGVAGIAAGEEPPADGFGKDGVTWRPSLDHDPIHIAALYLQHRLILAARHAWPHLHRGSDLTGSGLAELLGTPTSTRPAEKRLAGKQPLQLDDIVRLAFYLGDDIFNALPRHPTDLFPEPYRSLLGSWEPGHGTLPTFQLSGPGGHDWSSAVTRLAKDLSAEDDAGRDHLLTPGAVTHALVRALDECGTDPHTIELHDHQLPDDAVCTLEIGPTTNTTLASVAYLPDRAGPPRALIERLGAILHAIADQDADHRVLVLIAGQAATRQLRTQLPGTLDSHANTQVTVKFPTLTGTRPLGEEVPSDLDITVLAREQHQPRTTILAMHITKRR